MRKCVYVRVCVMKKSAPTTATRAIALAAPAVQRREPAGRATPERARRPAA